MRIKDWARPYYSYITLGLGVLCFAMLFTTTAEANSIPYRLYTISDGLPHENIQTIEQTPDGRLWVGTSAGLSFYTGTGFIPVRFLNARSTVNIREIVPLENDDVWVATNQVGIWQVRYQHAVQPFPELANVRASRMIARNDTLYAFSEQEIWQVALNNNTVSSTAYKVNDGNGEAGSSTGTTEIVSADITRGGHQWVLDRKRGPGRLMEDGTIHFLSTEENEGWYAIRFDGDGTAWVTHEKDGLFRFKPEMAELEWVFSDVGLMHICITPQMVVLTSYNQGALYWSLMQDQMMMSMNEESGLPTSRVNCMYRDHEGNGWVGTQIGLIHISHPGVKHHMEVEHRPLLNINAVYNDIDQSLWASSLTEGLFQLYPEQRSVFPAEESRWTDLFKGQDNRLYALGGSGWFVYDSQGNWKNIQPYAGGFRGDVDQSGTGYFWHTNGVYRHKPGVEAKPVYTWPKEDQQYYEQVLTRDGRLVLWANGQVIQVPLQQKTNQKSFEVIRDIPEFRETAVKDIAVDHLGRTWVALLRNGLLCVEKDTMMQLLPGYHIEKLSVEGDSLLIANAREGLFVFNLPEQAPKAKPAKDKNGRFSGKKMSDAKRKAMPKTHLRSDSAVRYHLTQSDGLMSSTVSGAVFTDKFLWVSHPGGVSQIPRHLLRREAPIPQVLLTSINYNGISRSPYREVNLKASDTNIGFEFSATTFSHTHRVHYRYRLKGLNERWAATEKPFVHFARLPAGEYEFEVQAATSNEYGAPISYDFTIPEPYYQRPVFWLAIMFMMTLVFYYLHQYRLRSMLQVERTRTQIAMDLHDDIGSSLTSLSFMSNLAWQRTEEQTPKEEISPLLEEIGSMSSELVDSMLDIVWSVDPKQDSVGSIVSRLQAFFQRVHGASEFSVNWQIEEGIKEIALPPRPRRNLYLIMKEAINNAIKHSGASRVDVGMTHDHVMLQIVIQDYGRGFDVDNTNSGYGLSTMRERTEESGASFEIRSSVGAPTTIYIRWPLRKYGS